jgi:isocitrate/isopropylmalate dehydrogenase
MIAIALLPGDGVGTEVLDGPSKLVHWLADRGEVEVTGPWPVGATAWSPSHNGLPPDTIAACENADAILLGAVGEHPGIPLDFRPELALIGLREHFDLRVSIRQVWRPGQPTLTFVRNLLAGAYGDSSKRIEGDATTAAADIFELDTARIAELADIAIQYVHRSGRAQLYSVDKANLLATSRLWRRTVGESAARTNTPVRHVYVDRMAFELGSRQLDETVVVTEGLFGDILSDLACGRAGSIALCSSASVHPGPPAAGRCVGLFEPVHGSAPLHAGADRVDPIGGYLALAALLDWFPSTEKWAKPIRDALDIVVSSGQVTYDLVAAGVPPVSTSQMSATINQRFMDLTE